MSQSDEVVRAAGAVREQFTRLSADLQALSEKTDKQMQQVKDAIDNSSNPDPAITNAVAQLDTSVVGLASLADTLEAINNKLDSDDAAAAPAPTPDQPAQA